MIQQGLSFSRFPLETDSSEAMNSQLRSGWLEAHAICYILLEDLCFVKYVHQLMGPDPSTRRRRRTLKPEAVPTIFQPERQPKASTQRKHSIKRTAKSEREAVSKQ